jgi:hypothetical protein
MVGGLLTSQLLTLYITPVFHLSLEDARRAMLGWFGRGQALVPMQPE